MSPCPALESLALMASGRLTESDAALIEAHVEECKACETILDQLIAEQEEERNSPGDSSEVKDPFFPRLPGYEIESVLGRGGMAVVYKARTTDTRRVVAIKVLAVGIAPTERDYRNWLREARSLARVPSHPNIVQFYNADRHEGCLFLVLELVEGGTLRDRLDGPLPPRIAARLMEQVARAVAHIHEAKLQHLDIKPTNILLDGRPGADWSEVNPRVADFGIARLEPSARTGDTVTVTVARRGTPQYMAPEQFEADHTALGPATDVYGLGATMYHLLTGRPPFRSANAALMHALVRSETPVSPRRHHRAIPRDLETICLTCLKKNPADRYPSATAVAEDLARWRNGFPIQARPVPAIKHLWQACRRRPGVATLMSVLFVIVLMSSVEFYTLRRQSQAAVLAAETDHHQTESALDASIAHAVVAYDLGRLPGSFVPFLETARTRQLTLMKARPATSSDRRRLAIIDRLLANGYYKEGKDWAAFELFNEAVAALDAVAARDGRSVADAVEALESLEVIGELGLAVHGPQALAGFVNDWCEKTDGAISSLAHSKEERKRILGISRIRNRMAPTLARRGEVLLARNLLLKNIRLLNALPSPLSNDDEIRISSARSSVLLGRNQIFHEVAEVARRSNPATDVAGASILLLALDVNCAINWLPDLGETPRPRFAEANEEPARWAERVLNHVASRQAEISMSHLSIPNIVFTGHAYGAQHLTFLRINDLDAELERDTARFLALAELVVERYPKTFWSHALLSEAEVQAAKLESRKQSPASLTRLQKAITEARIAVSLEPDMANRVGILEDRFRRYDRFKADLEVKFPGMLFPERDGPPAPAKQKAD